MFLLHITYASGRIQTVPCPSAFSRSLLVIALANQPVIMRLEDPS
jgi:hypothetical protein